jgi:hypothetical protein
MRLKIVGGTAQHGEPSLCLSCRHATLVNGTSLRDQIVDCGRLASSRSRVPFPVISCSGYSDRRQPSLREMEEIAWVLRTDARKNQIGFVHARDLKPRERYVLPDPDDDWS